MNTIGVNKKKCQCCGCGACASVCTRHAIAMECDENGFRYPIIDQRQCNQCGLCKRICLYNNTLTFHSPIQCYAAASTNLDLLMKSSSGGVFTTIAKYFIENNGLVIGAALKKDGTNIACKHIAVTTLQDLELLQGSKYVQSYTDDIFKVVKETLVLGKEVLFSGTPCQIASLKMFLQKEYRNLFTIDVICHGVPNLQFFNDYLKTLHLDNIENYTFRDKSKKGWGMFARVDYKHNDALRHKSIYARTTSYFSFFLDGKIYRSSCYSCLFAKEDRVSDMTLGDYWGFAKEHPEYLEDNTFQENEGISCVIVNTEKAGQLFNRVKSSLVIRDTVIEKIIRQNKQLSVPSLYNEEQEVIFKIYRDNGYHFVDKYFKKKYRVKIFAYRLFGLLPRSLKNFIKSRGVH